MNPAGLDLGVVVVTHNSAKELPACLTSLRAATFEGSTRIMVVDNASTDEGPALVRDSFPGVELVVNERNLGYARAVNQGAGRLEGRYLLILNPDVVVEPDALGVLADFLDQSPDVGLVAPRLLYPDRSLQYSCRGHYTLATYLLRRSPLRWFFPDHPVVRRHLMADWDHAEIQPVDWVLGAAMMVRREALEGPVMDERYFLYFEDVDLCLTLEQRGWKVVYHPGATMLHEHRRGSGRGLLNRGKYHHFRSWLKFLRKNGAPAYRQPQR